MNDIILLVEDNEDHAMLVQALLDYHGLGRRVTVTQSLGEARSYLLGEIPYHDPKRYPRPHIIILDHWLDDGTGLEFLEWRAGRAEFRDIPVIVFTGCQDPKVRDRALSLGAHDFLLKPDGYEELGRAIESVVKRGRRRPAAETDAGPSSQEAC